MENKKTKRRIFKAGWFFAGLPLGLLYGAYWLFGKNNGF